MYQALHNTTAQYLVKDCQLVSNTGRRRLRSADVNTCIVPLTRMRLGDRSFSVAGPRLWNRTFLFARDCDAHRLFCL